MGRVTDGIGGGLVAFGRHDKSTHRWGFGRPVRERRRGTGNSPGEIFSYDDPDLRDRIGGGRGPLTGGIGGARVSLPRVVVGQN
jgi:hypothetical protein